MGLLRAIGVIYLVVQVMNKWGRERKGSDPNGSWLINNFNELKNSIPYCLHPRLGHLPFLFVGTEFTNIAAHFKPPQGSLLLLVAEQPGHVKALHIVDAGY